MAQSNLTEITVWYQTILKVAGEQPHLVADGKFGPSTSKALECFQLVSRLQPSGILDVPTNVALNQAAMEWVYRTLLQTTPGKMTDELRNLLKSFQSHYGLSADGQVGPATRDVMVRVLRRALPSPLRHYHAHLGQGRPPGTPEFANFGLEGAPAGRISGLHGKDDRVPTVTTIDRPFRWVCLMNPEYETAEVGWGSGLLISPQHVLTAAHVILDDVDDGDGNRAFLKQAARVFISPGHDGRSMSERPDGQKPFDSWMGPRRHTPVCYDDCPKGCDYALVELEKPIGERVFDLRLRAEDGKGKVTKKLRLGYWGDTTGFEIRAVKPADLNGVKLFSAGYPHDSGKRQMRASGVGVENDLMKIKRRASDCYRNVLGHSIDAVQGQSGSPIWTHLEQDGKSVCRLVGVVISIDRDVNHAVALTEEVLKQIADWAPKTFQYKLGHLSVRK